MEQFNYFSQDWCNLSWSPWIPFSANRYEFRAIPKGPGLYRIRPAEKDFLMYIGETRRTLHQRLNELRQNVIKNEVMPWNDPHTAAPSLWTWMEVEGFSYECSAALFNAPNTGRKGMESYLLYRYHQEYGESTLCNFGRFHKRYRKSTNRKEGRRGGKLLDTQIDNPAGGPSFSPLSTIGSPSDQNWMGLLWAEKRDFKIDNFMSIPIGPCLYLLFDIESQDIIHIGQSMNCSKRLQDHSQKSWGGKDLTFSYCNIQKNTLAHNLKEMENDLIGNYFEMNERPPEYQFPVNP